MLARTGIHNLTRQVNGPSYSRRATTALILSPDPLGAALLGAATELAGFRVSYAADGESPPDCIRRVKPAVVLVDVTHAITGDPASLGPALMTGATVIFFGGARMLRDIAVLVSSSRAATIALPEEIDLLPALLGAVVARPPRRTRSE